MVGSHFQDIRKLNCESSCTASLVGSAVNTLPIMNVVLFDALDNADIGVAIIEISPVLLRDGCGSEIFNSVEFFVFCATLGKESIRVFS